MEELLNGASEQNLPRVLASVIPDKRTRAVGIPPQASTHSQGVGGLQPWREMTRAGVTWVSPKSWLGSLSVSVSSSEK